MYGLEVRELQPLPGADRCECDYCEKRVASHMVLDSVPLPAIPEVNDSSCYGRALVCSDCLETLRNRIEEAW